MSNNYYNHVSGVPAAQTRGTSQNIRAEFDTITAGFALVQADILARPQSGAAATITASWIFSGAQTFGAATFGSATITTMSLTNGTITNTPAANDSSTSIANTQFVQAAITASAARFGTLGYLLPFSVNTSGNAAVNLRYLVDTSSAAVNLLLPGTPNIGDQIGFVDVSGTFSVNPLTIQRNGKTIMGFAEDMAVTTNYASFGLVWTGTNWRLF
jgi:hypothetical protein